MNGEEEIIQQMGLLLMQIRFSRRALEDIERNTARYSGISFTNALAAGPRFGDPPLLNGALKVHVVNISDLNPGTGLGALIEGILGGIGRFFGGFVGGVGGGFASAATLPYLLFEMQRITRNINRILEQINVIRGPGGSRESSGGGGGIDLNQWTRTMEALANLFTAAGQGPGEGGRRIEGEVPEGWLVMLYTTSRLVEAIGRMIDGLIILIPVAVGALASLLVRLDDIQLKILEFLQFALRNTFLLRGVALVTVYDTLAGIARLGAELLRVASVAVGGIIASIFDAITALLTLTVEAIRFVGHGLQATMNGLLEWLRTGLGTFLIDVGQTDVFRLLHHLVRTLPLILPSLVVLVQNRELSDRDRDALAAAAAMRLPAGPLVGGLPVFTPFPDIGELLAPPASVAGLTTTLEDARREITGAVTSSFNAARRGLEGVQATLETEATRAAGLFAREDDPRLVELRQRAGALAEALGPAVTAAREQPRTGLEAIAEAYERWLTGGGLETVLNRITEHFQRTPTAGPTSERALIGRIVAASAGAAEPPTATIRIERVEIEIAPPAAVPVPAEALLESSVLEGLDEHFLGPDFVDRLQERLVRHERDWQLRGGDPRFVGSGPGVRA